MEQINIKNNNIDDFMRAPGHVMRLSKLGCLHQTRISFARTLVRRMAREKWKITTYNKQLDDKGFGQIVYSIKTPDGPLTFTGFSHSLLESERTDRVIAENWDATFVLSFGAPENIKFDALVDEVPLQELGRFSSNEFVLSRANKSVRLFEKLVDLLSNGKQPTFDDINDVGYLMRTTAVYGNGKFGLAHFEKVKSEGRLNSPFQAEMLGVYLIRQFTFDLIEHCAAARGGQKATVLARPIRRMLGIGNATGLGMAPYLINHPKLLNDWILARETALARVRSIKHPNNGDLERVKELIGRCQVHVTKWPTEDNEQNRAIIHIVEDLFKVRELLEDSAWFEKLRPWDRMVSWSEQHLKPETQELLNSILIEPYGSLVDDLGSHKFLDESEETRPSMLLGELKTIIENTYGWALEIDYSEPFGNRYFWYRSAEKEEPRLGKRHEEPGANLEIPIGVAHDVACLYKKLLACNEEMIVAEFLISEPKFRRIVRRIQTLAELPYSEIRDNLIGSDCEPINILRCKLSIFGATKFDPKSKLWTRITLFQGAPLPDELNLPDADDWFAPIFAEEHVAWEQL